MRPKKSILCVGVVDEQLSEFAFALDVWGHRVVRAEGAERGVQMLKQIPSEGLDLVLVLAPLPDALRVLLAAKILHPWTKTMAVSQTRMRDVNLDLADVTLQRAEKAEVRERIRILMARKRGPRGTKPPQSVPATAAAAEGATA